MTGWQLCTPNEEVRAEGLHVSSPALSQGPPHGRTAWGFRLPATLGIEENMEFQVTSGVLPKLLPWCSVHLVRVLEEKPLGLAGPPT